MVHDNAAKVEQEAIEKGEAVKAVLTALTEKVDKIKALDKAYDKLNNVQLQILLVPLKRSGYKIPTKNAHMFTRLTKWEAQ